MRSSYVKLLLALVFATSTVAPAYAQGVNSDTVVVVSKQSPTDILPAASLSNYLGADFLILDHENMSTSLLEKNKKILVVGGARSLKDEIFKGINFQRISGDDRYETSLSVLRYADKIRKVKSVNLISGKSYADSAIVASSNKLAVLVSDSREKNAEIKQSLDMLSIKDRALIGGKVKVNDAEKDFFSASRIAGKNRYETARIFAGENNNGYITSEVSSYYKNIMDAKRAADENKAFLFISPDESKYIINIHSNNKGAKSEIGEFLIDKNENIENMMSILEEEIKNKDYKKIMPINPTNTAFDVRVKNNLKSLYIASDSSVNKKELHIAVSFDGLYPKEYIVKDLQLIKLIEGALDRSIYSEYSL